MKDKQIRREASLLITYSPVEEAFPRGGRVATPTLLRPHPPSANSR